MDDEEHQGNGVMEENGSAVSPDGGGGPSSSSRILEVPLQTSELLEINLDELRDDESIGEIADLLESEQAPAQLWIKLLEEYQRRGSIDRAIELGERGVAAIKNRGDGQEAVPLLCMMASCILMQSRSAPKIVLPNPKQFKAKSDPKQTYFSRATTLVTAAEALDSQNGYVLDTKATLYLLTGKMDEAYRIYDHVLGKEPGHLLSLMGKARVLYIRNQYRAALKLYQSVLSAAPDFLPDPRIGIGLCFWNLGEHNIARRAWERSQTVNPGKASTGATLLLGLSWLNVARDPKLDEEDKIEFYTRGIQQVQAAWAQDKTCAATAAALSGYFLTSANKWDTVVKLAELAVQHGDSRAIISDGHLAIARALHAQNKAEEATRHYALAAEANPNSTVAALAMGQMHVQIQDWPAAIDTYDTVLRKQPRSIEAMVSLASIYCHAVLTDSPISDGKDGKHEDARKARDLFDQVIGLFQGTAHLKDGLGDRHSLDPLGSRVQQIATNSDLYVEIARLWMEDDKSKSLQAYRQGLGVWRDANGDPDGVNQPGPEAGETSVGPQLLCNIGCLEYSRGDFESAQERFEEAITTDLERQQALQDVGGSREGDATMMTLMYNLGIVMEARGQKDEAKQLYEGRLLARHPEFIEAKARLAALALAEKQPERCSDLLKAALTARPEHLDVRALYVYFLSEVGNLPAAKDFAVTTLKDFDKSDTYALSAMAQFLYSQARESRGQRPEDAKDRTSRYYRACEAFDKVIQLDPYNCYAAQGIAIALAENNLGGKALPGQAAHLASSESAQRTRNLRDALTILTKVRETVNDGNAYVNIGLCHVQREEWERAIESFETANNRFYHNKHLPTLLYLARARFHKANKDQSFATLQAALQAAHTALLLAPSDDAIRFNIALIQQRGLETVQNLPAAKRRVTEIQTALKDAEAAQESFSTLANNTAPNLPYSTDLADQRRRYGEGLIKRAPNTIRDQEEWEQSEQNKVEIAKRDREAERARQAEAERQRREEAMQEAERLAANRRQMAEDAKSWYVKPVEESEDDEEKGKKGRGRKKKAGDDGIVPDGEGEEEVVKPKKRKKKEAGEGNAGKRKKRAKKDESADAAAATGAAPVNGTDGVKPENGQDEEDEGPKRAGGRRSKKQFRTAEVIEDSDVSD